MRLMPARAMPVFPDEGSRMRWPGLSVPSFSAASIIARAMRSFTDPNGFWLSILARMRTRGFGLSALTSTSGVLPIMSSAEPNAGAIARNPTGTVGFCGPTVCSLEPVRTGPSEQTVRGSAAFDGEGDRGRVGREAADEHAGRTGLHAVDVGVDGDARTAAHAEVDAVQRAVVREPHEQRGAVVDEDVAALGEALDAIEAARRRDLHLEHLLGGAAVGHP